MARRNNTLSTDELQIVRKDKKSYANNFEDAMSIFFKECDIRNLRPQTIRYYRSEINAFLNLLKEQNIDIEKLQPSNVTEDMLKENVILYMRNYKGVKIVTINTRLRALRAFFNFLHKQKHIKKNPMENVKLLKDRKSIVATFTKEQLNKLFNQPDLTTFTGVRDYTMMLLLLETGIRANELVHISLADIRWEDKLIIIRHAKSYRERLVPFQTRMRDQLRKYIAIRGYL